MAPLCALCGSGMCCARRWAGRGRLSPTRGTVTIPPWRKLLFPGTGRRERRENEAGARRCLSASAGTVVLDLCSRAGDGNVSHFTDEETEASLSACLQVLLIGGGALPWPQLSLQLSFLTAVTWGQAGWRCYEVCTWAAFPGGSVGKEAACNAGETQVRSLGQGRSPGEGNGYPLNQDNSQASTLKGGLPSYRVSRAEDNLGTTAALVPQGLPFPRSYGGKSAKGASSWCPEPPAPKRLPTILFNQTIYK